MQVACRGLGVPSNFWFPVKEIKLKCQMGNPEFLSGPMT
jgi:hypothetical protein